MSEPAATNTLIMDATTTSAHGGHPSQSFVEPDQTAVASPVGDATHDDTIFEPGLRLALFSTELGTRPQRKAPSTPHAPPIARSNPVQAVVQTSEFWRRKLTRASLSIFPDGGWAIEDLWDAEDIHIYTPDHCREVLMFMSRDNVYCAISLADEVSRKYPEHVVKTIALSSMEGTYDDTKPFSFLDEIFVHGESAAYPRQFLWHTARIMRASMLENRANEQLAARPLVVQQNVKETSRIEPLTEKALLEPSPATVQQPSAPSIPPPPSQFIGPPNAPGGKRPSGYGPPHPGAYHGQQIGHIMGSEVVRNPKTRPHNHNAPAGVYGENYSQLAQGAYAPRPSSGTVHPPHFNPAVVAMGQAVMPSHHPMQAYPQGYQLSSPSLYPGQPYHPGLTRHGPLPQHQAYMPSPPMVPSNIHQPSNDCGSRGTSFGDMTNYYANNGPPHNMDTRRAGRRNSSYGNGNGSLYDPYNGTKPAFNDSNAGRRSSRGGFLDQPGRSHKPSVLDNRSRTGSYSTDWIDMPGNGSKYSRGRTVDDPAIISDSLRGCHQKWIGPENHIVNELFVSDLPADVQDYEVKEMFAREINIPPLRVTIKKHTSATHSHAFALFTTASEAKLGLRASDAGLKVRGLPVRITVPRRFYQKSEDYHNHYEAQKPDAKLVEERDTGRVFQMSSHEEESVGSKIEAPPAKLQYSPQDARSDLQKKTRRLSPDANSVSPTDSDAQGMTPQSSSEAQSQTERIDSVKEGIADEVMKPTAKSKMTDVDEEESESPVEVCEALDTEQPSTPPVSQDTDSIKKSPSTVDNTQPVIGDTYTTVEESVSHSSEHSAIGHVRVESQTKAPFEATEVNRDGVKKVPMVVKIPGHAKDDVISAKLDCTSNDAEKVNDIPEVEALPVPAQESSSDDEADPDASFQSAQEVVDSTESTSVPGAGLPTTNPGIETGTIASVKTPAVEKPSSPLSTAVDAESQYTPVEADQHSTPPNSTTVANSEEEHDTTDPTKSTETTGTTTSPPSTEAMKQQGPQQTTTAQNSTTAGTASGGGNSETPAKPSGTANSANTQSSTAAMKSQGPQQTPSLNPFAKPPKSQRKKEKQQKKKKESKKEQEEKNAKVKIGNAASANLEPDVPVTGENSSSSDTKAQALILSADSDEQAPQAATDITGKGKAKVKTAAMSDEAPVIDGNDKGTISSKQTGGTTTNIPSEIDSVTHKAKAAQMTTVSEAKDSLDVPAFTSHAQSHEHNGVAHASDQSALNSVSTGGLLNVNDAPTAPKIKETVPAIPVINFNKPPSFARLRNSRPSSSASVTNATPKQLPLHEMSQTIPQSDVVSNASSDTLHPSEGAQPSPSPTAEVFHTPLQTPTVPSATQDETPQPKKKKNKKKMKKPAAASAGVSAEEAVPSVASTPADDSYDYTADPFGNQMSHIDAIREATKDPNLYYNVVNREMAEKAAKEKADKKKASEKSDHDANAHPKKTVWREIEAFLRENPNLN